MRREGAAGETKDEPVAVALEVPWGRSAQHAPPRYIPAARIAGRASGARTTETITMAKVRTHGVDATAIQAMLGRLHSDVRVRSVEVLNRARCGDDTSASSRTRPIPCTSTRFGSTRMSALAAESRRKHEHELIGFYLDRLRREGVAEPPDADEAWTAYRLAMVWGLVIGWLITPAVNYGPAITDANLSRMVGACRDLDPFALLS